MMAAVNPTRPLNDQGEEDQQQNHHHTGDTSAQPKQLQVLMKTSIIVKNQELSPSDESEYQRTSPLTTPLKKKPRLQDGGNTPVEVLSECVSSSSSVASSPVAPKVLQSIPTETKQLELEKVDLDLVADGSEQSSARDDLKSMSSATSADLESTSTSINELGKNEASSSLKFQSSLVYVKQHLDQYFPKDSAPESLDRVEKIQLALPGGTAEEYPLIAPLREDYHPVLDLAKTVALIAEDFPDEFGSHTQGICRQFEKAALKKDFDFIKDLVPVFNDKMQKLKEERKFRSLQKKPLSFNQCVTLLDQVYARTVLDPDILRQYKGFSKEVYGETRPPVIDAIIRRLRIKSHHVFLDLGSGIGNVVLQVSAQTRCKCYGVELLDTPAVLARRQVLEFRARLQAYGRSLSTCHLKRADFLEDRKVHEVIERADIVFVNNYAFESDVNVQLKLLFLGMKEGAKIVCFAPFRAVDYTITEHNMNDVGSILTVEKYTYNTGGVSWTASPGVYYIHKIDRSMLQDFVQKRQERTSNRASKK